MDLREAGLSLKLECALRSLSFVENGWKVVGYAGLYYIEPISLFQSPSGDLLGFQLIPESSFKFSDCGIRLGHPLRQTARSAIDFALEFS